MVTCLLGASVVNCVVTGLTVVVVDVDHVLWLHEDPGDQVLTGTGAEVVVKPADNLLIWFLSLQTVEGQLNVLKTDLSVLCFSFNLVSFSQALGFGS